MSKFFAEDSDDSDNRSNDSDTNEADKLRLKNELNKNAKRRDILEGIESSEEEERHVVISEKQKRTQKMREIIQRIRNKFKNNDFGSLLTEFEELVKEAEKGARLFEEEGGYPRFYIRILCEIQNHVLALSSEEKKKLNNNNNKAYNTLKMKIKKHNEALDQQIKTFLENPVDSDAERREQQSKQPIQKDEEDDEDEDQKDDDEESDEDDKYLLQSNDPMIRRRYWLKKVKVEEVKKDDDPKKPKIVSKKVEIDYDIKFKIAEIEDIKIDFNPDQINRELIKIVENRGRLGNQTENIYKCEKMIQHFLQSEDFKKVLEILLIVIQLQIDQAKVEGKFYINRKSWQHIFSNLKLLSAVYHDKNVSFQSLNTYSKYDQEQTFSQQRFQDTLQINFLTLENELSKAFHNIDFFSQEYAERLSDLYQLIYLASILVNIFTTRNDSLNLSKLSYKQLELCYYFSQQVLVKLKEGSPVGPGSAHTIFSEDIQQTVSRLTTNIYHDEELVKKAILFKVYNLALHGDYEQARNLMLSTVSQESATQQRVLFQVTYNRALVQLAIAAFRQGLIYEAHTHLLDLMNRDKDKNIRDLLAQNYSRAATEAETAKHTIPYHLTINVDLIETVYFVSAMLLEIPNIHQNPFDDSQKVISKKFRQFCVYQDQQAFIGNPETTRDIIYAASKALGKGDWKNCWDFLKLLQFWSRINNLEEVQEKVLQRVKAQALKCYLFTFKQSFTNLSIEHLSRHFELPLQSIKTLVFRVIYRGELKARIDPSAQLQVIFTNQAAPASSRLDLQLAEKINQLTKLNEKVLDAKAGSYGFQQSEKQDQEGQNKSKTKKKKLQQSKSTRKQTKKRA